MTHPKRIQLPALLLLLTLLLSLMLSGCAKYKETSYETLDDLRGKKIAAVTGSVTENMLKKYYGNDVEICYYNSNSDMAAAVDAGKADGYIANDVDSALQCQTYTDQYYIPEILNSLPIAYYYPKTDEGAALRDAMDEFISAMEASGEMEAVYSKWTDLSIAAPELDTALTGENGTLVMACCTNMGRPQCYMQDNQIVGSDIEFAYMFCRDRGYSLELMDCDFGGMLAAVTSGKADFAGSGIGVTEEREKSANFSKITHYNNFVITVKGQAAVSSAPMYDDPEELEGKTIGCISGASTGTLLESYYGGSAELEYYNANADMAAALAAGKIDAYCTDNYVASRQCRMYDGQVMMEIPLQENNVGFFFRKDDPEADALREQMNEFILELKESGVLDEMKDLWYNSSEENDLSIDTELTGENGTVTLACSTTIGYPFCYVGSEGYMGYDIDLAYRFCRAYGYGLELMDCDFGGMLGAVTIGKADFGGTHLADTPEREETVNFSEPYDVLTFNLVVKTAEASGGSGFFSRFVSSFEKTFITESRWKLFLGGIGTTLLITVLSVLLGTLLGYFVYMACRTGNRIINKLTNACMWLINGMPTVVLLMLLFYVILGSSSLSGTWVAVIAYTLIFAVGFTAMLRQSVESIDPGQLEAAYALGYTKTSAFNRRILPQAVQRLLPAYKAQTVALIKSTAIVGYIAVQDLTKAGDIIRSRTFEAFFPIIATAVFYFLMAALLSAAVRRIEINTDPKRRSREKILKGVEK